MRISLRVIALVVLVAASPWLIAGAERLNAALDSSLARALEFPGAWILGLGVAAAAVAVRLRSR